MLFCPLLFVPMPPRKGREGSSRLGLECGLSVPKFLQPYQDLLGDASVFKNQIQREREEMKDSDVSQLLSQIVVTVLRQSWIEGERKACGPDASTGRGSYVRV